MFRIWISVFATAFMLMVSPASASEAASTVVDQARRDCKSFENGVLDTTEQTISLVDLTGDAPSGALPGGRVFSRHRPSTPAST
jgi:hypothetical protein